MFQNFYNLHISIAIILREDYISKVTSAVQCEALLCTDTDTGL